MWYKNKLILLTGAIGSIAIAWMIRFMLLPIDASTSIGQSSVSDRGNHPTPSTANPDAVIAAIAKQVTVRIITGAANGSGVIVNRQGNKYTVLTCEHVVTENQQGSYQILTADGKTYPAQLKQWRNLEKLDLGLVEFESPTEQQVVKVGNLKSLAPDSRVYAAGFPNYHSATQDNMEDTSKLGRQVFRFTSGAIGLILQNPALPDGYSLGYTNEVELGMSGGPVLNDRGELVGINGRSKYPIQGIDAFTFADGTKPSIENFEKMEPLSWAVPIYTSFW